MKDFIGQPLKVGDTCILLSNYHVKCKIIRFTTKMIVVLKENKTQTEAHCYGKDLINIEVNYKEYPELLL